MIIHICRWMPVHTVIRAIIFAFFLWQCGKRNEIWFCSVDANVHFKGHSGVLHIPSNWTLWSSLRDTSMCSQFRVATFWRNTMNLERILFVSQHFKQRVHTARMNQRPNNKVMYFQYKQRNVEHLHEWNRKKMCVCGAASFNGAKLLSEIFFFYLAMWQLRHFDGRFVLCGLLIALRKFPLDNSARNSIRAILSVLAHMYNHDAGIFQQRFCIILPFSNNKLLRTLIIREALLGWTTLFG